MSFYFIEKAIPLSPNAEPTPFPLEALPPDIRNYTEYIAKSVQVHPDMPAVLMLSVLAACAQGKARVCITPEWSEELNLYTAVVAEPGERKSAVFSALTSPVQDYVNRYNQTHASEIAAYRNKLNKLEARKTVLISSNADDTEIDEIQSEILNLTANPKLPLRLIAADCTPEAVAVIMASNRDKIAIMSDEGVFDVMSGLYTNGRTNINIYLNAYDGQPVSIDRKGSGSLILQRPLITFGICCQPAVISDFISNKRFIGKGLAQRFLYSQPPSMCGKRSIFTEPVDKTVKSAYTSVITNILDLPDSSDHITMSNEAFALFNDFYEETEKKIGQEGKYSVSKTFLSKLLGKTARISGLLHLCGNIKDKPISSETMRGAIEISRYFVAQNDLIFTSSTDLATAEYVADRLLFTAKKDGRNSYRARDIKRFCQKYKGKQIDEALVILEEHRYVQFEPDDKKNPNRQYGVYTINPTLLNDRQGIVKPTSP